MHNLFPKPARRAAKVKYESAEFHVLMKGDFVTCAVTGEEIPLSELTYWSAEYQEPYIDAAASYKRYMERRQLKEK